MLPCGSVPGCSPGAGVAGPVGTGGLCRRPQPGGQPPSSCLRTQPEAAKWLEGLLQNGTETILSGTFPLRSTPGNIRYLRCKRLRGFIPLATVSQPCSPGCSEGEVWRAKGVSPASPGPAGAFGDPGQSDLAAALVFRRSILNRGQEDLRWWEPPPLREAGRAPGHGRWGSLQLPRLLGRSHDSIVDVTREMLLQRQHRRRGDHQGTLCGTSLFLKNLGNYKRQPLHKKKNI